MDGGAFQRAAQGDHPFSEQGLLRALDPKNIRVKNLLWALFERNSLRSAIDWSIAHANLIGRQTPSTPHAVYCRMQGFIAQTPNEYLPATDYKISDAFFFCGRIYYDPVIQFSAEERSHISLIRNENREAFDLALRICAMSRHDLIVVPIGVVKVLSQALAREAGQEFNGDYHFDKLAPGRKTIEKAPLVLGQLKALLKHYGDLIGVERAMISNRNEVKHIAAFAPVLVTH